MKYGIGQKVICHGIVGIVTAHIDENVYQISTGNTLLVANEPDIQLEADYRLEQFMLSIIEHKNENSNIKNVMTMDILKEKSIGERCYTFK